MGSYTAVLRTPGALRFCSTSFLARLPFAICGLAIVLLVSGSSGSYAFAGAMAAAFALAAASCSLFTSRWVDRLGQHRVLPLLALGHAGSLVGLVLAVTSGSPIPVQFLMAILSGATQPAIGPAVRARWSFVLVGNPVGLRSAYALESILDEAIFTVGPLITTTLALHLALPMPLILAAVLTLVGVGLLAPQRATEPPATARSIDEHRGAIRMPGMAVVSCTAIGIGSVFGSYEVSTVAFASSLGQEALSGPLLAAWALASGLAGLWYGSRQWTAPLPRQLAIFAGLLCLALLPAPFVPSVPFLVLVTLVSGAAVAPTLIAIFSLVERLVPGAQLTESLTWANSGLAVGFSAGVSIAGAIIDRAGPSWSFALSIASAALATALAIAFSGRLQRAERPVEPHDPTTARNVDLLPGPQPGTFTDPAR